MALNLESSERGSCIINTINPFLEACLDETSREKDESFSNSVEESFESNIHGEIEVTEVNLIMGKKTAKKAFHFCTVCNKPFNKKSNLTRHMLIHTGEKAHICNVCQRAFTLKADLKSHYLTHSGEKPHECKVCKKRFARIGNLREHEFIHSELKRHVCEICSKAFNQRGDLRLHLFRHSGKEKPYKCEICTKSFTLRRYLEIHSVIHTGEKPHVCNICNEAFGSKASLKKHSLFHSGEKNHVCNICQKSFVMKGDLNRHSLVHREGKSCSICCKTLTRKEYSRNFKLSVGTENWTNSCERCFNKYTVSEGPETVFLMNSNEKGSSVSEECGIETTPIDSKVKIETTEVRVEGECCNTVQLEVDQYNDVKEEQDIGYGEVIYCDKFKDDDKTIYL